MRIILLEMKKIWNLKILAALVLVCALFYVVFMSYYIDYYRKNHPQAENIYYAEELVRLYGTSITPEELTEFIFAERSRLISEAEHYIRTMSVFAEAGIHSFDDYSALREDPARELTQAESDAHWTLMGEECNYLGFFIETLNFMESELGYKPWIMDNPDSFWQDLNAKEQARYRAMLEMGEHHSVLSYWTYDYSKDYAVYFSILLMLAVLILVSPLLVTDRNANLHHLQYSSKLGRKIMHRQLIATLLCAFMLTTLLILIFGGTFYANGTCLFWESNINSEFNIGHYSVFRLTYGQWVIAMIALMYILALGFSMFAFILSRFSRNLITLVMKLVPAFAAAVYLCIVLFNDTFSMLYNALYRVFRVFGTEAYICGAVAAIAVTAVTVVVRRERRVDVM